VVRRRRGSLPYFDDDAMDDWLARLTSVRHLLTDGERTLAQGCLAYLWALHPAIIPLPGARTVEQARQNARAMEHGPLDPTVVKEIDEILAGSPERQ